MKNSNELSHAVCADGLLLVDKPRGVNSFHLVAQLRRLTGIRKIGHAGTLDPFASGLMVLAIGRATRLLQYIEASQKQYHLEISFANMTATGDCSGEIVQQSDANLLEQTINDEHWPERLRQIGADFIGDLWQKPPMYSAVKIKGKPLYQYARAGIELERKSRLITLYKCELVGVQADTAQFDVACSKGTYMRTLAESIGESVGLCAHASALQRMGIGCFSIENACVIDDFFERYNELDRNCLSFLAEFVEHQSFIPLDQIELDLPQITLLSDMWWRLRNGQHVSLPASEFSHIFANSKPNVDLTPCFFVARDEQNALLGIVKLMYSVNCDDGEPMDNLHSNDLFYLVAEKVIKIA